MRSLLVAALVSALSLPAQESPPDPQPAAKSVSELLREGIVARSPAGRFAAQDFQPGVRSLRTTKRCTTDDVVNFFRLQPKPEAISIPARSEVRVDRVRNERTKDLSLTIGDFEDTLLTEVMRIVQLFSDDPMVNKRELYLVAADFQAPNAMSLGLGFLVFDPQLFFQIVGHEETNGWSLRAIVAHEFAHQLQFWHDEPLLPNATNGKRTARDMELQADCVASAILTRLRAEGLRSDRAGDDDDAPFATALRRAFASLGDFELEHSGHHGTAYERALMVEYGQIVAGALQVTKDRTAAGMLAMARSKIEAMNARYGDKLWPLGSRL
jgi:hypothetical protein